MVIWVRENLRIFIIIIFQSKSKLKLSLFIFLQYKKLMQINNPENKTYLLKGRNVPLVYTKICWQMLPQEWWFDREHFEVFAPLTRNTKLIIVRNEGRTSLLETIHDWWSNNRPTYKKVHKNCVSLRTILKW